MKLRVYLFGNFRSIADKSELIIEFPENVTVSFLFDYLISQYPKMSAYLSPEKIKKSHVLITCGEIPVRDYSKKLKDGDQLYLFIMLAGG
jgi:molybdopterin converting factor small subunit